MTKEEKSSPINFPCDFVVKVMGKASTRFEEQVLNIVLRHFPNNNLNNIIKRNSRDNNYAALSVTVHAQSQEQLNALYEDLTKADEVLFAL